MIHHLMRLPPIILQNIIILRPTRTRQLLRDFQDFGEGVVGDVGELGAVVLGDDEGVPARQGLDVEEGEGEGGVEEFVGGDFVGDDFAEDAGGRGHGGWIGIGGGDWEG